MKSKVKKSSVPEPKITFPCLLKHKKTGCIVLVSEDNESAIVVSPGGIWRLGEDYGTVNSYELKSFKLLQGEVCLSN